MEHHEPENPLSREERIFNEELQRGDDFFKIEIFRSAKSCYLRALEMNMNSKIVQEKIKDCDRLLKYERKIFSILGIVAVCILILGYAFFM